MPGAICYRPPSSRPSATSLSKPWPCQTLCHKHRLLLSNQWFGAVARHASPPRQGCFLQVRLILSISRRYWAEARSFAETSGRHASPTSFHHQGGAGASSNRSLVCPDLSYLARDLAG